MPLYEYECEKCGHRFEKIQKFSDPPVKTCPRCKGTVKKLPSAPAIQFKGSGWYITDYARKSSPGSSDEKGSKDAGDKGAKGSDEKGKTAKEKEKKKGSDSSSKKGSGD